MKLRVKESTELMTFLLNNTDYSKNKIKSLLKYQNILVNGKIVTKYNFMLSKNNTIEITNKRMPNIKNIEVLYEDDEFLVVNKKANLLTVSTDKEKNRTLFHQVYSYVKDLNKNNKVFIVHRLDKETSGIVLFAKNEKIKELLQEKWNDLVTLRQYQAIVSGCPLKKEGEIKIYLTDNKENIVYKTNNRELGKLAITKYKTIKTNDNYSLLNIEILTGRKNKIRVSMLELDTPIVGDKKYKSKEDPCKRLMLHATKLEFIHPISKKKYKFESPVPKEFNQLMK